MRINDLENTVLAKAFSGNENGFEQLRRQVGNLRVKAREYTGAGVFVDFDTIEDKLRVNVPDCEVTNVEGESDALQKGFGCAVFIRNGQITTLECFSYDEPWPSDLGKFRIR